MDYPTLILTTIIAVLAISWFFFRKRNKLEKLGVLHPKPWPIFGNIGRTIFRLENIATTIENVYKFNKDAEYVGMYNFGDPVIVLRSPDLIKNITVKNFDHFVDHPSVIDPTTDELFGKNLAGLRGDNWKEIRSLLSPAFTGSKMKSMFKLMWNCGDNFANYFVDLASNGEIEIDSKEAMTRYTNDVIGTCAFGISIDSMKNPENEFYKMGRKSTNFGALRVLKFLLLRSFPKISKFFRIKIVEADVEKFFINVVKETIETRDREGITRPDMIQLMMESRGKKSGEGPKLTITDMTAQAFVFFFAGFDASSSCMCFVAHMIATHEEVQKKLHEEIDQVLKDSNGEPTYETVNAMKYLDAVVNETLRLLPITPATDRVCVKTYQLPPALPGGEPIVIEPGQSITLPIFALHKDPKYFTDPEKFEPERFMDERKSEIKPFTYMPFGIGPRMCIANRFAILETKVVLFQLLAKCDLKSSVKTKFPVELACGAVNVQPKGGFWLRVASRKVSN